MDLLFGVPLPELAGGCHHRRVESLTKPKVSREQLDAIALKHFGTALKDAIELREIAPPPSARLLRYEENLLQVEVETMRLVQERTEVPVPKIIAYDRSMAEVDSEYFLMDRLLGVPYNTVRETWSEAEQVPVQWEIGHCLRQMHRITSPQFGLYNGPHFPTWREAFMSMFDFLEMDGRDLQVELPEGAFALGRGLNPVLESVEEASLVHWDLWDGNVFVDRKKLTGVIDFERALWGDPLIETTFLELRPGLMEGYGLDLFNTPYAKERRLLYDLYLFLVMVIESKFRGFTIEHEAWPRMKLEETLKLISLLS